MLSRLPSQKRCAKSNHHHGRTAARRSTLIPFPIRNTLTSEDLGESLRSVAPNVWTGDRVAGEAGVEVELDAWVAGAVEGGGGLTAG
jgi:hypothetical protein